eukprot:53479-Eustigmatos_ZCMA.PRE.1
MPSACSSTSAKCLAPQTLQSLTSPYMSTDTHANTFTFTPQVAEDLLLLERELYMNWFIYVFESPEAKGNQPFLDTLGKVM